MLLLPYLISDDALYEVVKCINKDNTVDFIYTDEDKILSVNHDFD